MSLRILAEADLEFIIEDKNTGFGIDITIEDPDGASDNFIGYTNDIGLQIDPETGLAVSGQEISFSVRLTSIMDSFSTVPKNITNQDSKPWLVSFVDTQITSRQYKICEVRPDNALGIVTCFVELYQP